MSVMAAPNELFKLVSLRGPDSDRFIDPTDSDDVVLEVLRDFSTPELKTQDGAKLVRAALANLSELTAATLQNDYPWLPLLRVIKDSPDVDLSHETVRLGSHEVLIPKAAMSKEFKELHSRLYHSWLGKRLKKLLLDQQNQPDLPLHVDLLRAAHLIRLVGAGDYNPRLGRRLLDAPIVFPQRWRRAPGPRIAGRVIEDRRTALNKKLAAEKQAHKKLVSEVETIESLNIGVNALVAELEATGKSILAPLKPPQIKTIVARSPGTDEAAGNPLLSRFEGLAIKDVYNELEHDKNRKINNANDLCSSIRVFEEEIEEKLPPPREVQSGGRPSIRSIGWGDLIVARETLVGYQSDEIAHIENVLPGEKKTRSHERTTSVEEVIEAETVEETFSERDLETSDRFELLNGSSETIDTDFSIEAGVNTSGRYGLTKVDTSLDAKFSQSNQQSFESTLTTAKEVVSKTVERTQQRVSELRRVTTLETIRELSEHVLDNTTTGTGGAPSAISGIYYWVDKIHQIDLRHFGKRLMVEFYVPEPGVSLIEHREHSLPGVRKPSPFTIGPSDITVGNYMCLTKLYGAEGVKPPPPAQNQVGISFATNVQNTSNDKDAESTVEGKIKIPEGYVPYLGAYSMAGRGTTNNQNTDLFDGHISVAGFQVLESSSGQKSFYTGTFEFPRLTETDDLGIPVTGRFSGHDDSTGTLNIQVWCWRSSELYQRWQIETYERIRQAYDVLRQEYEQELERLRFAEESVLTFEGRPAEINRDVERGELKKWAIKTMRTNHFEFDAVVGIGEDEDRLQEIDAAAADEQTPVVRFFESAFEWRHMSYFLFPYFWGRRGAWLLRQSITVPNDPLHERFLKAGFARVVVPIMPGFEARVLQYLDTDPNEPDEVRIPIEEDIGVEPPASAETLWEELRTDRDAETARGNGLLVVQDGSSQVSILNDSWHVEATDIGREIFVKGNQYQITDVDAVANTFNLNRAYAGPDTEPVRYLVGSVPYGQPWNVKVPTRLVVLHESRHKLESVTN
jgi:hypothetical protein